MARTDKPSSHRAWWVRVTIRSSSAPLRRVHLAVPPADDHRQRRPHLFSMSLAARPADRSACSHLPKLPCGELTRACRAWPPPCRPRNRAARPCQWRSPAEVKITNRLLVQASWPPIIPRKNLPRHRPAGGVALLLIEIGSADAGHEVLSDAPAEAVEIPEKAHTGKTHALTGGLHFRLPFFPQQDAGSQFAPHPPASWPTNADIRADRQDALLGDSPRELARPHRNQNS